MTPPPLPRPRGNDVARVEEEGVDAAEGEAAADEAETVVVVVVVVAAVVAAAVVAGAAAAAEGVDSDRP
jgi:hypothetical protein